MHELQRAARFLDQAKDKAAVDTTIWCALKAILIHLELQEAALESSSATPPATATDVVESST